MATKKSKIAKKEELEVKAEVEQEDILTPEVVEEEIVEEPVVEEVKEEPVVEEVKEEPKVLYKAVGDLTRKELMYYQKTGILPRI